MQLYKVFLNEGCITKKFHKIFDTKIIADFSPNEFVALSYVKLYVCEDCISIPEIKNKSMNTNKAQSRMKENICIIQNKIKFSLRCFLTLLWSFGKFLLLSKLFGD